MKAITIITIVVIALLTLIIFGLTWLAFNSCIKEYQLEVNLGKHDKHIKEEYQKKKKGELLGLIGSCLILTLLAGLFITGVVYKASGENFTINNKTVLVIKSSSMADFYDEETALEYNYDKNLQFDVGDICVFEKVSNEDELIKGEVYGYKDNKNNIITHRLVNIYSNGYEFQGDNNPVSDYEFSQRLISRDNIIYHYTAKKVRGIGSFILYSQSYFGIWSLAGIISTAVFSEVMLHKVTKIEKKRLGGVK